jgi:hypothetical protein
MLPPVGLDKPGQDQGKNAAAIEAAAFLLSVLAGSGFTASALPSR